MTPCPLCDAQFESSDAFQAHLADSHGLVDDPGTASTIEVVPEETPLPPPPSPLPPAVPPLVRLEPSTPRGRGKHTAVLVIAIVAAIGVIGTAYVVIVSRGSDTKTADVFTTTTSPLFEPDSRTSAQVSADSDAARAAVLTQADLPDGWSVGPPDEGSHLDNSIGEELLSCAKIDAPAVAQLGAMVDSDADSNNFVDGANRQVTNTVGAFASPHNAVVAVEDYGRVFGGDCLQLFGQRLKESIDVPSGVSFGTVETAEVNVGSLHGRARWTRLLFAVHGPARSVEGYVDLVFAARGRFITMTLLFALDSPFPEPLTEQLSNVILDRLPA